MAPQPGYKPSKHNFWSCANHAQIIPIVIIGCAYSFFVLSAFNYKHLQWFLWLVGSRLALGLSAVGLVGFLLFGKKSSKHLDTMYLTFCLCVQASHGILEGSNSTEFYEYTGILFIAASLSYKGSFRDWIRFFLPVQFLFLLSPAIIKQVSLHLSLPQFVDRFSFPIACLFIGTTLARLSATKFAALLSNVHLQDKLLCSYKLNEERYKMIGQLAAQVSHDIRSPLTALRVLVGYLAGVPEEHRVMIRNAVQRIEDIANDLRAKQEQGAGEAAADGETASGGERSVQLLSSLIEPLISEKRTQHRAKLGVEIHAALDAESYGLFAAVQSTELKRVISNLINNAVEAMNRGLVTVAVRQEAKLVVITVTDTGKGIPPELLPQLMQHGATFGKAGGSGLGLYHARTTLESWGGTLTLASQIGVGTTATVTLPRAEAPAWFVPELVLTPGSTIVIVDDDVSIHQIWQERLEALDLAGNKITLQHFSSGTEVVAWFHGQANTLFLCDYEFLGQPNNGLELIAQLGIHNRAILVTSHFDEAPIQQRCAALGVRLIPKGLAGFVPIRVIAEHPTEHAKESSQHEQIQKDDSATPQHDTSAKPTALVLDDDDGIRCVWPMEGRRLGLGSVTTFASMEDCEAAAPNYAQFDFAFVDKNIPDSAWRLDQVITHLKACGVKKVLVASGESARALANDPLCANADGVIPMKIPQRLPM